MSRFHAQFVGGMDATSMSNRPSTQAHVAHTHIDISLLQLSDRACLRLLEHTRVATATQLAYLIYPSIRTALRRTRKLYLQHLLTREPLPAERGGIPYAYRLSQAGRRRLHLNAYRSPGLVTLRHALDGVEFVASLVAYDPGLVSLWLTESHIPQFADDVHPDQLVVIDTGDASAVLLVEIDESTERPPVIRERLEAYARLFEDRLPGFHLLWVVNSPERLARLRQYAGPSKTPTLAGRCWGVSIGEVSDYGAEAEVVAIVGNAEARSLRDLASDPSARLSNAPVGSDEWIRLLANGGRERLDAPSWQGLERAATPADDDEATAEPSPNTEEPDATAPTTQPESSVADLAPDPPDEPRPDMDAMLPSELVGLIINGSIDPERSQRAARLLAEREYWYDLMDALGALCESKEPLRQLRCAELAAALPNPRNLWLRERLRGLMLALVDPGNDQPVVDAALAALERVRS
jgi:hypothetical protein